jgi:DNA invertase Pin-like site-specific DNA recombinase
MLTVSYERISEDKTGEGAGVDRQHGDNKLLAQAKGRALDRRYVDNSISALDESKTRPEFEKLIADVRDGRIGMVIVWHLDRLAVRVSDLARLLQAAKPHQVTIAAVHGVSIDLSDPTGVAVATILVAIAEMERRHKGIRQAAANLQRASNGKVGWTRRPFGYGRHTAKHGQQCDCPVKDGSVFIVEHEAVEYLRMVDAALNGATLASIAADLNDRKVPTSTGSAWGVTSVKRVLLNPRHAGRAVSNGKDHGVGKWDAIIDADTHERLIHILRDPRRKTAPSTTVKYLLSGMLTCGRCRNSMFASPYRGARGEYMIYRCPSGKGHLARRLDRVDAFIEELTLARLERPDAAKLFAPDVDLDRLRNQVVELRQRRDGIAAMLADGLISVDAGRDQATKLTTQITDVEREIASATGHGPLSALADADDVRHTWAELDVAAKRAIIGVLFSQITIEPLGKGFRLPEFEPDNEDVIKAYAESISITWRTS